MAEFSVESLTRLGISFGKQEDAAAFCEGLQDDYHTRIGKEIARVLTPEQLEEYDDTPEEELASWLETNYPDYQEMCNGEFAQVAMELFLHRRNIHGATVSGALESNGTFFIDFMYYLPMSFRKWMIANGVYSVGQFFERLESFNGYMKDKPFEAAFVITELWAYLTGGVSIAKMLQSV